MIELLAPLAILVLGLLLIYAAHKLERSEQDNISLRAENTDLRSQLHKLTDRDEQGRFKK